MQLPTVTHHSDLTDETRSFPTLTPMQEAFVHNYVANGGIGTRAAKGAGYAKASAHVEASKLLRKQPIIHAIGEAMMQRMATLGPRALDRVAKLSDDAKSEYVQLEASKDILTRIGAAAPARVHHTGGVSIKIDLG